MNSGLRPWIIAHRGARSEAPENTKRAFDLALSYPIDGIELDAQLTKDGVSVIYHDRTLSKFKEPHKRVSDYRYDELRRKGWRSCYNRSCQKSHIITLDEVLCLYSQQTRLMIEIKSRPWDRLTNRSQTLTTTIIESIRRRVPESHHKNIFLLSFDATILTLAHYLEPHWNYVLNMKESDSSVLCNNDFRFDHLYGLCISVKKLTAEFKNLVNSHQKTLFTYTCNSPKAVSQALSMNVDVIMTDKPGWILKYLKKRGHVQ